MTRGKRRKNDPIIIDSLLVTNSQLHYMHNGWSFGYGVHRSKKTYSRKKKHKDNYLDYKWYD